MSAALSVKLTLVLRTFTLDVAFDVPPGVTVLFGPSGSGKSRTLACIAGIVRPDRGRIALGDDVWFADGSVLPIERRRVGYLFQSLALFPHMTAEENVAFGLPRDLASSERSNRVAELLGRMHVPHLAKQKPPTFSGGEAQRVALARALAMKPQVILLDEPFSALDEKVKGALMTEVRDELAREKIPTILVTHREDEARALGDRRILIDAGRIVD